MTVIPGAPQEFRDLVEAVTAVQVALKWVDSELMNSASPLAAGGPDVIHCVVVMCNALRRTLDGIDKLVARYRRVAGPVTDVSSLGMKLWGKLKWAHEKKTVAELASRLKIHTISVNLYMNTVNG